MKRLIVILLFIIPSIGFAHPLFIQFNDMIDRCSAIYIAEFTKDYSYSDNKYEIKVEQVLKGKSVPGTVKVGRARGGPLYEKGKRFIAFINEKNEFEWGGTCDSLETGLIYVDGFYDYNAYDVSPSGLTLVQLKQYLAEKKFTGEIDGELQFFNYPEQKYDTGVTTFHATFTYYSTDSVSYDLGVKGLDVIDFKDKPVFEFYGGTCEVSYDENMVRPLEFYGFVDSVYSDGHHVHSRFEVKEPENIDMKMFYEYVAHPEYGPLWSEKEFSLASGEKYTLVEGVEMGRIGYIIYKGDTIDCPAGGNPSVEDSSYYLFGYYDDPTIRVDLYPLPKSDPRFSEFRGGTWSDIYALRMTNYVGRFYVKEKGVLVDKGPVTLSLKAMHFTTNLNYRK